MSASQACAAASDALGTMLADMATLNAAATISTTEVDALTNSRANLANQLQQLVDAASLLAAVNVEVDGVTMTGVAFATKFREQVINGSLGAPEYELRKAKLDLLVAAWAAL